MDDLVSRVASQKRKNNFFELSQSEQLKLVVDVFNGISNNFTYGDTCIIVHSSHTHIFDNSKKKDYINEVMQAKEKVFEIRYGLELKNEKSIIFNKMKDVFHNNKTFFFLDSDLPLNELEIAYGISNFYKNDTSKIYSNDEYIYQVNHCEVENYLKGTQTPRTLLEMEIRLSFLGSFKLGLSNCLPEYVYQDKKYSVQFGDKTISKIYEEINFNDFKDKSFMEVTLPILYKFTLDKFKIKLIDDKIAEDIIEEELDTLELIIKHNLSQNLKMLDISQRVDRYDMEIKRYIRELPQDFGTKETIIPIVNKNLIKDILINN